MGDNIGYIKSEYITFDTENTPAYEVATLDDPLDMFIVNDTDVSNLVDETVHNNTGNIRTFDAALFLARNDKIYSLGCILPEKAEENDVGICLLMKSKGATLYFNDLHNVWSIGDVPVPSLEQGDEIRLYSTRYKDFSVIRLEFDCYILKQYSNHVLIDGLYDTTAIGYNPSITSSSGDKVDSLYNLTYGEKYSIRRNAHFKWIFHIRLVRIALWIILFKLRSI